MITSIPLFVLAFLQAQPSEVSSWLVPQENLICWQAPDKGLCLPYTDEGTHLIIHLNGVE
jgi:hypothetical protein